MLLLKIALPALIVGVVSLSADRYPSLSGYVAVVPVVTLASLLVLVVDGRSSAAVTTFLGGALVGLLISAVMLATILLLLRGGLSVVNAVTVGVGIWLVLALGLTGLVDR